MGKLSKLLKRPFDAPRAVVLGLGVEAASQRTCFDSLACDSQSTENKRMMLKHERVSATDLLGKARRQQQQRPAAQYISRKKHETEVEERKLQA